MCPEMDDFWGSCSYSTEQTDTNTMNYKSETKQTDPDGERPIFAADSAAAVRTAWFRGAAILLLLLKDLWVEFLQRRKTDPSVLRLT